MSIIENYVRESREHQRQIFGEIGLKEDCENFRNSTTWGKYCHVCVEVYGHGGKLQCECGVCHFYKPKEWGNNKNESDD